jgi:hypothetical protein
MAMAGRWSVRLLFCDSMNLPPRPLLISQGHVRCAAALLSQKRRRAAQVRPARCACVCAALARAGAADNQPHFNDCVVRTRWRCKWGRSDDDPRQEEAVAGIGRNLAHSCLSTANLSAYTHGDESSPPTSPSLSHLFSPKKIAFFFFYIQKELLGCYLFGHAQLPCPRRRQLCRPLRASPAHTRYVSAQNKRHVWGFC